MNFKRLLGAQNGWGGAIGTLLLLGFGLFILFLNVAALPEASRLEPEERGCAAWLADPSGPRWVTLVGCRLDVFAAASPEWRAVKGTGKTGERFIPLFADAVPTARPRGVLATSQKDLLKLLDGIERVAEAQDAGAEDEARAANAVTWEQLPDHLTLTGFVAPVPAHLALGGLTAADAVVLHQGRQPPRAPTLLGLLVGLLAVALVVRSLFLRYLVERDSTL